MASHQLSQGRLLREKSQISRVYWNVFMSSACCSEIPQPFSLTDGQAPLFPIYGGSKEKTWKAKTLCGHLVGLQLTRKKIISYHLGFSLKHTISEAHTFFFFPFSNRYWNLLYQSAAGKLCLGAGGNCQLNHKRDCTCHIYITTFEIF